MVDSNKVLEFWFPERDKYQSFWFDHSKDSYIKKTFTEMCYIANNDINFYKTLDSQSINSKLSYIILLDQFMRNISNTIRFDSNALLIANYMLEKKDYEKINRVDYILFILLPLRHTKISSNLYKVLEYLEILNNKFKNNKLILLFKQHTLKSFTSLQDELELYTKDDYPLEINYPLEIVSSWCKNKKPTGIDFNNIELTHLYKSVLDFIKEYGVTSLCISLSGGVDSIVLSYILCYMRDKMIIHDLCAVHLNYGNRESSDSESNMIKYWCSLLKIPLIYRKIKHMLRDNTEREFYENETKNIRFELYKIAEKELGYNGVCLGHHGDDLEENVFMNICKGKNILELGGMSIKSVQNNITIFRPMLNNFKDEIYNFATNYNVIYTHDTTPELSQRGKLRNEIFPLLKNFGICRNLYNLGMESDRYNKIYQKEIFNRLITNIIYKEHGFMIPQIMTLELVLLKQILINCFHKYGYNMIKNTNLNFCYRNIDKNNYIMSFSNGANGYLVNGDLYVYLFKGKKWLVTETDLEKNSDLIALMNGYFILDNDRLKFGKMNKHIHIGKYEYNNKIKKCLYRIC